MRRASGSRRTRAMSKSTTPSVAGAGVMIASEIPARLLYSARTRADLIYRAELADYDTTITLTREQPQRWSGHRGRIDRDLLAEAGWPPAERPLVYLFGPRGFVEGVADALVSLGHEPSRIRAERFGPT